jgi:hypothetical protein
MKRQQMYALDRAVTGFAVMIKFKLKYRVPTSSHLNRMAGKKLVKIADWNPIGVRTKGRPKNRWRDETICDLKKVKLRNWSQFVKDRKSCIDLVQQNVGV